MVNNKIKALFGVIMVTMFCISTGYCAGEDDNISDANLSEVVFEDRMVYFDRALDRDENYLLLQDVIVKAETLGFNALVLNEEFIYSRLSHDNSIIASVKERLGEIELMAHAHGLKVIVMHFNAEVPTFVVQDGDAGNRFYQDGKFDFSEAAKVTSTYNVVGDEALIASEKQVLTSAGLFDILYHFTDIKPYTEYKLTVNLSTNGYAEDTLKVSVLDEDHRGENGKVLFGIQKYFRGIQSTQAEGNYSIFFNSLDHKNLNGALKVFLAQKENLTVNTVTLEEVGFTASEQVVRSDSPVSVEANGTLYTEGMDYLFDGDRLLLLGDTIKAQSTVVVTWYPRIDVSRFHDHETTANICADERLYHDIMIDQYQSIKTTLNGRVDGIAFNDDEWREAGWDDRCRELYAKEFEEQNLSRGFTGGDYIGISTKRMIENILKDENQTMKAYVMSDMFDPNFNAKDPYMGVRDGAIGAVDYLPSNAVVFNWFPNPFEPGLEDKTESDFLASAQHFSDHNISQIIAGYHDDMRNLDANINFYKNADAQTQKSIIGFMFLIWHQPNKTPSYDDMDDVVKRICTDLPGKWDETACKALEQNDENTSLSLFAR